LRAGLVALRWGMSEPTIVRERVIHSGKKFDFVSLTVRRSSGRELDREVVRHPGAVVVVPVFEDGRVVLIRNYRIAIGAYLYECCAGTIERERDSAGRFAAGEKPSVCAARELIEETGYEAGQLAPIGPGWFYTTPGLTDEQMFVFAATELRPVGQKLEDDETIEVVIVAGAEAITMVMDGRIRDAKSMLSIMLAREAGLIRA
jgi:ADP-ribose pyrophosphatase